MTFSWTPGTKGLMFLKSLSNTLWKTSRKTSMIFSINFWGSLTISFKINPRTVVYSVWTWAFRGRYRGWKTLKFLRAFEFFKKCFTGRELHPTQSTIALALHVSPILEAPFQTVIIVVTTAYPFITNILVIYKAVNWFGEEINWLVTIGWEH